MVEYTLEEHALYSFGYDFDDSWGWYKVTPAGHTLWIEQDADGWQISLTSPPETDAVIKTNVTNLVDYLKSLEVVFFQGQ